VTRSGESNTPKCVHRLTGAADAAGSQRSEESGDQAAAHIASSVKKLAMSWGRYKHGLADAAQQSGSLARKAGQSGERVEVEDEVALSLFSHAAFESLDGGRRTGVPTGPCGVPASSRRRTRKGVVSIPREQELGWRSKGLGRGLSPKRGKDAERARKTLEEVSSLAGPAGAEEGRT
jgi:hypothetical protein